ncbi:MAG TPA: Xaa-Pro peptidase family protein [Candidatus Dormibacteraeota bacterium]|nr:Xaa-Pro peptidase family protein [Candidatus Dormibacteraeota bacterium]
MKLADKPAHLRRTLDEAMAKEDLDAVVAMSPESFLHLAGVYVASQRMIRERLAIAVYPRGREPFLVVSSVVASTVRRESWVPDQVVWTEHERTPIQALAAELKARGLEGARIGLEMHYLAAAYFEQLKAASTRTEWVDCELLLNRSRMVKTPDEVELMRRNAIAAERAIWAGFMFAREGTTEREIASRMVTSLFEVGGDYSPFMSLAAGAERSRQHHAVPGEYRVRSGDTVAVDMVGTFSGYYSDYARMAVVGRPAEGQRKAWRSVVDVQRQVMRDLVPGVTAGQLARNAASYMRQLGYELDTNLVGHSLGTALHEYPPLTEGCTEPLLPNMTMCIEILVQDPEFGRFHVEDLVVVGSSDGARRLTTYFDTDDLYQIVLA